MGSGGAHRLWSEQEENRRSIMLQDLKFQLRMVQVLKMERNIPAYRPKPKEVIKPKMGRPRKHPIDKDENKRDIIYLDTHIKTPPLMWKRILIETAMKHGVSVEKITGSRRLNHIVLARHEAMWRMKNEAGMSYPAIARRVGVMDHTSCIHGVRAHEARMKGEAP